MSTASSPKLGIGTTSPDSALDVHQDSTSPLLITTQNATAGTSSYSGLNFKSQTAVGYLLGHSDTRTVTRYGVTVAGYNELLSTAGNGILFGTNHSAPIIIGTNDTERMRILSGGNVGIGTTAPSQPLHVAAAGTGLAALFTNTSSNGEVMRLTTTGDSRSMHFQTDHIYQNGGAMHLGNDNTNIYLRTAGYKLGVGTSNPTSGFLMDVSGSTRQYGSFSLVNGAITSNPGTNHLWASGATLFWGTSQIGTTTPGAGAIEGTATAGQVSYGDGSNSITSTSNFTFTDDDRNDHC